MSLVPSELSSKLSIAVSAADFAPAPHQAQRERIVRPSLSYWQDVWQRLCKNRRALSSLYIVIALLVFTLVGPWLWTQAPALQDLDAISQGPSWSSSSALVVEDPGTWPGVQGALRPREEADGQTLGATASLAVAGLPSTQYVRLYWEAVNGAQHYLIYRNDHAPESNQDLGLPLGATLTPDTLSFEDRLQLRPQTYWYSVIASDGFEEAALSTTAAITLQRAITASQARERGLDDTLGAAVALPAHPFGTDYLGRDLLARVMEGARVSLFIGIVAPLLFVSLGIIYGGIAGYFGGNLDILMMRVVDFVIALPFLLFMILFRIGFGIGPGESGIIPMLLALVLLSWPDTARLIRGQILQIRGEAYVQAARVLGAHPLYLIFRHLVPNTLGPILVTLTFAIPMAIFTEAFLSFIGMGVSPPTSSWGSLSNEGIRTMLSSPHELLFPAFFISLTVLAFNLLGDGLRDALDSRLRSRE
ncbi:MAG: ABC transporter permease [Pseudomonadales bacterium]|jgi:oligopeptide transport system permease protein|nr:ABC transporter permease [Pseudomonadales bacterium]